MLSSKAVNSGDKSVETLRLTLISLETVTLSFLESMASMRLSRVSVRCRNSHRLDSRLTPGSNVSRKSRIEMNSSLNTASGTMCPSTRQMLCRRTRLERSARSRAASTRPSISGVKGLPWSCLAFSDVRASGRLSPSPGRPCSAFTSPWARCRISPKSVSTWYQVAKLRLSISSSRSGSSLNRKRTCWTAVSTRGCVSPL